MMPTLKDQIYRNVLLLVGELHRRSYERLRIRPGMSPSGLYWRCSIKAAGRIVRQEVGDVGQLDANVARYTSGQENAYFGWEDAADDTVSQLADKFIMRFPELCARGKGADPSYAQWYREMLSATEPNGLPIAYADYDLPDDCWSVIYYNPPLEGSKQPDACVPLPPPDKTGDL